MVPRILMSIETMPILGTGKTDYESVRRLAATAAAREMA
jgi:hypothetical protein